MRLVFILAGLFLAIWTSGSLGVWLFVKYQRGFPDARYTDLLLPHRWAHYRESEGEHYIAQAEDLLKQGEVAAALFRLRSGISKAPANTRGRTLLARLFLVYRRPDLAREVLLDGLRYSSADPVYLQTTLAFLLGFQEDDRLRSVTGRLLAAPPAATNPTSRTLAATYAATVDYYHGNYDRAEDLIHQHHLRDSADGATLLARIEWARGYPELALLGLNDHLVRHPGDDGARALLASYYRSLGRAREWEIAIVERLVSDPLAAAPRIEYLHLHDQRGDRPGLERETEAYLGQFRHDAGALLLLADFAANTGRPALARRVQQAFPPGHENTGAAALLVAEAHIAAGEYQPALDLIDEYARRFPAWTGQLSPVFHGLQAVALSGLGKKDEARLRLEHLLAQKNLRADNLVAVANRLSALGARDLSGSTLNRAVEADPLNQAALASLLRLELETGALARLPAHLDRFIRTRQPSREILARAYEVLGSDRQLFLPRQTEMLASLRTALDRAGPRSAALPPRS